MRKVIKVSMIGILLCVLLVGCGKSEAAKRVDEKIASIGEISVDSGDAIAEANDAYDKLTEKEKKTLSNYGKLESANSEYKEICESLIDDSKQKINDLDVVSAYEQLMSLPSEYEEDVDALISEIDKMCYDKTFIVKVEQVVSTAPKTSKKDKGSSGWNIIASEFSSQSSLESAMSDYYKYLSKYYDSSDGDSTTYDSLGAQSYEFKDKNHHVIKLTSISFMGMYNMNVTYSSSANYRDVIEVKQEESVEE